MALDTEVEIVEQAMSYIGIPRTLQGNADGTLASCTDTSIEKAQAQHVYDNARNKLLEEHPWTFARKVALLTLGIDLAQNATTEPWAQEWSFAYDYPTDCARLRRFVGYKTPGYGYRYGGYGRWIWPWVDEDWKYVVRVRTVAAVSARYVLTDVRENDANMSYTERVTDPARYPPHFREALAWLVARDLAMSLALSADRTSIAIGGYDKARWAAKAYDTNEDNPYPDPDGPFIRSRRGR